MIVNPYDSSMDELPIAAKLVRRHRRWIACMLIAVPFLLALPVRYWALNHAGGWFVSTDLEADHRRAFLGLLYTGLMLSIAIWCFFGASVLLWLDSFHPVLSTCAAVIFGVLAIPASIFLAIGVTSYFQYN